MTEIGWHDRLREERERLWPKKQEVAAELLDIRREVLSRYETGKVRPGLDIVLKLDSIGVDVLYVLTGRRDPTKAARDSSITSAERSFVIHHAAGAGKTASIAHLVSERAGAWLIPPEDPARSDTTQPGASTKASDGRRPAAGALLPAEQGQAHQPLVLQLALGDQSGGIDYHVIPRQVLPAAAGNGVLSAPGEIEQLDLAGDMAFTAEWLRHNLGHTSGSLCSVRVHGDSMSTTLLDGDTILIDQAASRVDVDGIYVLQVAGRCLVKRVQRLMDDTLVLISDNPRYQPEKIARDRARDVRVLGRMVWPRVT